MEGPLHYYEHVQKKHAKDPLKKIVVQEENKRFFRNYPNNSPSDYELIEVLESKNIDYQVEVMATSYPIGSFRNSGKVPKHKFEYTYAEVAFKFASEHLRNTIHEPFVYEFFLKVKDFLTRRFGKDHW